MKYGLLLLTVFLSFSACQSEKSTATNSGSSIFDWLSTEEDLVTLEIKGDLTHLFVDRHGDDHYHPAELKVVGKDSTHQFDLEISRRGVTRKKICDFPPIKLKFPKKNLTAQGLSKFNNYKLVTHCMEGEDNLVLKEYLIYKLFNQLSDKSFQVKLAKIRYIDESGEVPDDEHYGFLIEGNKELADRLAGKLIDPERYKITSVDKEKNVRERFLQWRGKDKTALLPICEKFKAQKAAFFQICQEFEDLDAATKEDMIGFLETFFEEVENETFL